MGHLLGRGGQLFCLAAGGKDRESSAHTRERATPLERANPPPAAAQVPLIVPPLTVDAGSVALQLPLLLLQLGRLPLQLCLLLQQPGLRRRGHSLKKRGERKVEKPSPSPGGHSRSPPVHLLPPPPRRQHPGPCLTCGVGSTEVCRTAGCEGPAGCVAGVVRAAFVCEG